MALVSMGVYVFNKPTLFGALDLFCGSANGFDFGHDIIPALIRSLHTYAYDFRDKTQNAPCYWRDIGTIDAYYSASMELLQAASPFDPIFELGLDLTTHTPSVYQKPSFRKTHQPTNLWLSVEGRANAPIRVTLM
jgi:ADP-glucose pyrophosphorylase